MVSIGFTLQILACILAILYFQFRENPALAKTEITIITRNDYVENHLGKFRDMIGDDYEGYRNHIYRVLTYTMHFLDGDDNYISVIATALVYHDIGLWSAGTLAYLKPGVELSRKECEFMFSTDSKNLLEAIILNHHKIWPVQGSPIVEAVRKADWIDASYGVFNKGMPRKYIAAVQAAIPNAGFHKTLIEFGPRLHGSNVFAILSEIITIFKW